MTTSQGNTYNFIYDTTAGIPAVLMEQKDSETPKLYIRTPDGRLIARVTATETPTLDFYYHFDGLGSTRALTDSGGNTTNTYKYDVWGNVTYHAGTTSQPYQFVGQLGYYNHYQDPKLRYGDMLQLGVRYYMPSLGRFTQRDPVMRTKESPYIYAADSPLSLVDPDGLAPYYWVRPSPNKVFCLRGDDYRRRAGGIYHSRTWTRTIEKVDKWELSKCVLERGGPKVALCATACALVYGVCALTGGGGDWSACMVACMTLGPGDEQMASDVLDCWKDSKRSVEEVYLEEWCEFANHSRRYNRRPSGDGWK